MEPEARGDAHEALRSPADPGYATCSSRRWTSTWVAHASGLSYPYVSQLETGYRLPSHKSVAMLASALELEPSELSAVIPYPDLATGQSLPLAAVRPLAAARPGPVGEWRANPSYVDSASPGRPTNPGQVAAKVAELVALLPRDQRLDALSRAQRQVMDRLIAEEVDESR